MRADRLEDQALSFAGGEALVERLKALRQHAEEEDDR